MAIINKTGITNGGTVQAEHVTRAIDALSGVSTDSIIATGSFTGSFTGPLSGLALQASQVNTSIASDNSTHYILLVNNTTGQQVPLTDTTLTFNPSTNALALTGSFTTSGSLTMTAAASSVVNFGKINSSGNFAIPVTEPSSPLTGSIYFDLGTNVLYIYDGVTWRNIN